MAREMTATAQMAALPSWSPFQREAKAGRCFASASRKARGGKPGTTNFCGWRKKRSAPK